MRLPCTTAILRLLAATGNFLTGHQNRLPAIFALGTLHSLRRFLVDQEFAALDADTSKNLLKHLEELDVIDRSGQGVVPKVARAAVIIETTGSTEFAVFQDTHTRVRQTADLLGYWTS